MTTFEKRFVQGGLSPERARRLAALALPAVRLDTQRLEPQAEMPVGGSRLGGRPDLAPGFTWPRWKQRPLSFLGQVNLADVAGYPFCSVLPASGVLSFFYDQEQETWGFDPNDRGSWLVHFEPDPAVLRRNPEASPMNEYAAGALAVSEVATLPPVDSLAMEALAQELALSSEEQDAYARALEPAEAQPPWLVRHQLLGHPAAVQGDMQLECQLASNGVYCGDPSGYQSARARELGPGAGGWRLLMQIDTDDALDLMWGDCGRLYFWLTDDALRRRAFGEAWMILQCS